MKILHYLLSGLLFSWLICFPASAQNSLEGNVKNWSNGDGYIAFYDMLSGEMSRLGTINSQGNILIPLDADYLNTVNLMAKKAAEKASKGWEIQNKTVSSTFSCLENDMIAMDNGETLLAGLPELSLTDKNGQADFGILYAVSTPEIAHWLFSYGDDNISEGYYLKWIFTEKPAGVNGDCTIPTYTGNGEEMYDDTIQINLKLNKGWNIIKYDIVETYTSQNGKIYPSRTEVTKLEKLPENLLWEVIQN